MSKKKNIIILILIALVIILIATIACITTKHGDKTKLVSTFYHKVLTDEERNEEYTYDIPKINLESDDAKKVNTEIYNEYVNECIQEEKNLQEGLGIVCMAIDYKYYINSNILSLVVRWQSIAAGAESFNVYNIDVETGENISNEEIIAKNGLTQEQVVSKLKELYKEACYENNMANKDKNDEYYSNALEFYNNEVLPYTLSDENCNINVPMFLDENGKINVVAYIGSMAGAGGYYHILNTGM